MNGNKIDGRFPTGNKTLSLVTWESRTVITNNYRIAVEAKILIPQYGLQEEAFIW